MCPRPPVIAEAVALCQPAAIIQKRLKKEKKAKRKLQEALEYESKRREQVEHTLKQPSPSDSMRSLNGQTPGIPLRTDSVCVCISVCVHPESPVSECQMREFAKKTHKKTCLLN